MRSSSNTDLSLILPGSSNLSRHSFAQFGSLHLEAMATNVFDHFGSHFNSRNLTCYKKFEELII